MNADEIREKIWRIADGIPFKMGNMTIRTTDSGKLLVTGWTDTIYFENINKNKIIQKFNELKSHFSDFRESFNELDSIVKNNNLTVEFYMAYSNGGKEEIGLCSEIEGERNWYI